MFARIGPPLRTLVDKQASSEREAGSQRGVKALESLKRYFVRVGPVMEHEKNTGIVPCFILTAG